MRYQLHRAGGVKARRDELKARDTRDVARRYRYYNKKRGRAHRLDAIPSFTTLRRQEWLSAANRLERRPMPGRLR